MKNSRFLILLLALLTIGQVKAQGLTGSGTTDDPYLINDSTDWITFAQSVTSGTTYANQTVKLTADISVSTMAGVENKSFAGTFDGDGHTINLALSSSGNGTALFSDINGATLKNLKAEGTVTTTDRRPATFVAFVFGNSTISNCWSTVAVSSTRTSGWVDGGGLVARVSSNATLNMTDCAFHGTVTFAPDVTSGGGMIGYTQNNATVNLTNCLYSPFALTLNVSQYNPRIFVSGEVSGNLTNCYYNAVAAASVLANQGIDASGITNAALAAALGVGWHVYNGMVVPYLGEYSISSTTEWNTFAQSVTNGKTYAGQIVKLTADISVTTTAGDENTSFAGTFDGQGHTITLNMTTNVQYTALFYYADGATFQNLKVGGTINISRKFCAGFVGAVVYHGCTFTNCVSDITINSSISGDGTHGGFVGYAAWGYNTFEGCAFTGKLLGANTTNVGGFVGYTESRATVSFTNCVFHPQQVTMSGSGSQTFARWRSGSNNVTIGDNCYYSQTLGAAQGKQMRSITGGDYVTVAFSGEATTYERSGISAYSVGIVYDSTLYAGSGDTVSLNLSCTPPSGYVLSSYTTSAGTLTGTANPYTLTMPNEAVTIQAVVLEPLDPVAYIDENGVEQQCTFYTVVTDTLNFYDLPAGWYVVSDSITLDDRNVHFSGDAHLILCDGATMNISVNNGDALSADGSLTLYGQSAGTGSLTATSDVNEGINAFNLTINGCTVNATSTDDTGAFNGIDANDLTINGSTVTASGTNYGIYTDGLTINGSTVTASGSSIGIFSIDLTINGSTVTASANDDGGIGIGANRVTINSGTVNATGNDSGIYIGYVSGYVTINGGTVTTNEIYSPMVTLGWSDTNDSITVGSFDYYDPPTVSVKSGKAFYYQNGNDTVIVSGTLTTGEIAALSGKTLVPYGLAPVAYIDENGVAQECTSYTVVTDDLDFPNLPAGWYVVINDITIDSSIYFTGDAHLILCDGATMNISVGIGAGLSTDGSLTLYGQSEGTGSLTATSNDGNGIVVFENLTINGGTVTATGYNGDDILATNLTINGGTVTTNEIFSPVVTLGWSNLTDRITVGSFTYNSTPTVSVKNGQTFYYEDGNETVTISGTLDEDQINAIGGKTLFPYLLPVAYIDENGVQQQCTSYTVVTDELDFGNLPAGWYVVNDNITLDCQIYFIGDAHLILCDGASMNISVDEGIVLNTDGSLTLYGQNERTGSLTATSDEGHGINATNLTINGSTVIASANGDDGMGIGAASVTINSGTVNATGNVSGIYIGNASGYVTINGGTVTTNELFSPTVTLGWSNTNDSITIGSFAYSDTFTVSVKTWQALCYEEDEETVVVSGTLTTGEIAAISGKTLRPYIGPCAPPYNLEVTDITAYEANLHWNSTAESYNVSYYKPFFFDSFEEDLSQWTVYKEGDDASWEWSIENPHDNSADLNAHSGYYAVVSYSDFDVHADSWLVTPQIQFPNQTTLKFWIMRSTYDDAKDEYEVRLSTTGNAITDFTTVLKEKEAANPTWTEVSIDLSAYDGQQGYIAIRHDFTDGFFIMVDDFGIYGWSEDIVTTDNSLLIEDLLPETEYQWHVQANCGEEVGLSQWSGINNFTTLSTCPVPIGLSASNETNHGATLDWTGLSDSYQVMVGSSEVASWTTYIVTEVPFILDDAQHIQPGTSYTVKVKGFCDDEETDFCEPIVFTTTFSCWPVNSLSYENLTSFSVNLNWILLDEAQTAWQICLNDDENNLIAANTNEGFLLDDLMPNVEYTVKVRAYCGENDYSRWSAPITFTTPEVCATPTDLAVANITALSADLSWIGGEDVESYTVRYRSVEGIVAQFIEDFSDNIDIWTLVDCEPRTGITNGAFAFYRVTDANNPTPHQYLISPELTSFITSNSVLEFKYRAYASSYPETFMVGFSSTNKEVSSFSWSDPITVSTNAWQTYHADLPADTKYIAIQCTSYLKFYLIIDDIVIGNEAIAGPWMTKTTAETETQLINLHGGTTYEAQVRSDCNPDGWCDMITFETELDGTMVFVTEGDWNTASNWIPEGNPALDSKVIIRADATVPSGCVAEANRILFEGTTLTIEDGGLLKVNSDITATIKKNIIGYGPDNEGTDNGFYLIASPATDSITAANAGLITTQSDYDLYSWNRTATNTEWHNYKKNMFSLSNGTGYLYANHGNMEMNVTATLQRSSLPITMTPAYDEEHGGWNLYGNPFPCEAYLSTDDEGMVFYRLVGNEFVLITGAIAPLEGFFVVATAANQTFTISREAPAKNVQP